MEIPGNGYQQEPATRALEDLTEREHEILTLVATGLTNKEIAAQLHLSEKTVKYHMTKILHKLQVRNRVEAAMLAQRSGGRSRKG